MAAVVCFGVGGAEVGADVVGDEWVWGVFALGGGTGDECGAGTESVAVVGAVGYDPECWCGDDSDVDVDEDSCLCGHVGCAGYWECRDYVG